MAENIYRKTGPDTFEPVDLQDRTAKRLKMDQSQLGLRFDEIPIGAHFGVAPSIVRVHATAAVETPTGPDAGTYHTVTANENALRRVLCLLHQLAEQGNTTTELKSATRYLEKLYRIEAATPAVEQLPDRKPSKPKLRIIDGGKQ
ncbi:MAG: hypothetical protein WBQ46_17480 [Terriglobales bacterium]